MQESKDTVPANNSQPAVTARGGSMENQDSASSQKRPAEDGSLHSEDQGLHVNKRIKLEV